MYEIPSQKRIKKCIVTPDTVRHHKDPLKMTANGELIYDDAEEFPREKTA